MYPQVGPVPAFAVGWTLALVFGGGGAVWLLRRAGIEGLQASLVLLSLVVSLLLGSKLLYLVEAWPKCCASRPELMATLCSARMRLPGGFALLIATTFVVARFLRVRSLWLLDTIIPAAGLCIAGIRTGCLLEGCCYGIPTSLPWGIQFPAQSPAYRWLAEQELVELEPWTVPVHPLQVYFGIAGVLIFIALQFYKSRKRYDGEVLLLFGIFYLWSTWLLELFRASPHDLTRQVVLVAAVSVTAAAAVIEWQLRYRSRRDLAARTALATWAPITGADHVGSAGD